MNPIIAKMARKQIEGAMKDLRAVANALSGQAGERSHAEQTIIDRCTEAAHSAELALDELD